MICLNGLSILFLCVGAAIIIYVTEEIIAWIDIIFHGLKIVVTV